MKEKRARTSACEGKESKKLGIYNKYVEYLVYGKYVHVVENE